MPHSVVTNSVVISIPRSQDSKALEFIVPRSRSRSRDLGAKVLVSVSRAEWQGLIHCRMQQILRKCSEYSKNRILGTALVCAHNIGSSFKKMYCIIGFELVCVFFRLFYANTATSAKVSVSVSRPWDQGLGLGLEFFLKKVLTTTVVINKNNKHINTDMIALAAESWYIDTQGAKPFKYGKR